MGGTELTIVVQKRIGQGGLGLQSTRKEMTMLRRVLLCKWTGYIRLLMLLRFECVTPLSLLQ